MSSKHFGDIGMATEMLISSVLGEKYYGLASGYTNVKIFKKDIKKLIRHLKKAVDQLVASEHLIEHLSLKLDDLSDDVDTLDQDINKMYIVVDSLNIISALLGYHYQVVGKKVEPYFIPSTWQDRSSHKEPEQYFDYQKSLTQKRVKIAGDLKRQGYTDAEVLEILNISKYKAAQLIKISRVDKENKK